MTTNTEIIPQQKLKVFISSICGQPKYDTVRAELKEIIEHKTRRKWNNGRRDAV